MKVTFVSVGKIKEKYFVDQINEHLKSMRKYVQVDHIEVPDEKCPEKLSEKEMIQVKDKEGVRILEKIPHKSTVVALAIDGKKLSSKQLDQQLSKWREDHVMFIIGGSLGLSEKVLKRSNFKLSFSDMTFPHQLMKVMLTEQIDTSLKRIMS